MKKKSLFYILLFLSVFIVSCSDDDDNGMEEKNETRNIVQLAQDTNDLSSLVAALGQADAGLVDLLQGTGPFTVFAPTNTAFTNLLNTLGDDYNSLDDFDTEEEKALLANILKYHVISGTKALSSDLSNGQTLTTALGENLTVNIDGDVYIEDATDVDAKVTGADIEASNGVVHVIDKILLPQSVLDALAPEPVGDIVAIAQDTESLSALVAAVAKAGLVETLQGDGPFTVFAPTNDAFTALLAGLDGFDSLDDFDTEEEIALLTKILTYHVVAGTAAKSTDLTDGQMIETVQGESVTVSIGDGVMIDDANVALADVMAANGVVHVIDKVILPIEVKEALGLPTKDIVGLAVETEALSSLVAAVTKAGLVETLQGDGPFTVFAPTNDAFAALLQELDGFDSLDDFDTEAELDILTQILTYHVVAGTAAKSTDLTDGQMIETVQGESVTIGLGDGVTVDDANVTTADVMGTNGVVHLIDKVIVPESLKDALFGKDIVELAIETEALSSLVAAVTKAGLVETLQGDGPFTVFAPTNDAFAALLEELDGFDSLDDFDTEAEIAILTQILTYHVVAGTAAKSTDLTDGQMIETVQGESVTITIDGGVMVENAMVTIPDVMATNGVVHVIDEVIIPDALKDDLLGKNIVGLAQDTDDLSLLVAALIQADAGLVEALQGDGPFTVFAPTNAAFAALLDVLGDDYNSLDDFDTAAEKELLASILTYHVVAGASAFSTDLTDGQMIETLQGESVTVSLDGGVFIDDAQVSTADVEARNGVVHIIDKVILPNSAKEALGIPTKNIVELAQATDALSNLVAALVQADAGLVELLAGDGPFTVFAPTNDAFATFLAGLDGIDSLDDFDTPAEKARLAEFLKYHVVSGAAVKSTDLTDGQMVTTAQGTQITINLTGGVFIDDTTPTDAEVTMADVMATNGVVHIIDKVLDHEH
jgi:uncharacterized surface protein with fasciclin (FAS1) repeats